MHLKIIGCFDQQDVLIPLVLWENNWYTPSSFPQASSLAAGVATQFQPPWRWSCGWQTSVSESNSCSRYPRVLPVGVQRNWRYRLVNCWCTVSNNLYMNVMLDSLNIDRATYSNVIFVFFSCFSFCRTSMCASAACLCRRLISPLHGSMWPKLTAGLWRSCAWRSLSPPPRVLPWTPAASASKVR